ncbi:diguanylate cyclase (GGDEF) domain-containing protein [Desulfomicrobium apsheronum]|uniref:Diguanylate cyclase (GGDEF) domain-containing protein n=1 Tax=Desulfomicrobium apsheronum TaxID=52560 RepID=A0A1I3PSQ5_9BACT|nr:EAL domain-containing protein [Desulfomicrobium apsheronum]SFJ23996.1 diguanylate cyclase (GGDEF) domain-containing protein [Desulfomicrobium apsheronum]
MLRKAGLDYRRLAPRRPLKRRAFALLSSCKAPKTLSGCKQEIGEREAQKEKPVGHGGAFCDRREEVLKVVKKALRARKNAEKVKFEFCSEMESTLREANEKLVVASVNAKIMNEATERIAEHLSYMAEHDLLTGLPSRGLLKDRLNQSILLAKRHGNKVALMFLDLDHFKRINDSMGHACGDQLLQSVAKRLQASVRLSDTVSRHGGDEFVVLLPEVDDVRSAVLTAEKLIQSVGESHLISGQEVRIGLSIGISMYPDDGVDAEMLMRKADIAMYQAKSSGRNSYQIFSASMNSNSVVRKSDERALERALEHDEFILHYQPTVHLESGAITGAEVLLRWERSGQGLNFPAQFITIAESSGLILPIGEWVLREACRQARAWLQCGLGLGRIAVNVSAAEFSDRRFLSKVRAILEETGLDPRYLQIEMGEDSLSRNPPHTLPALQELKNLGVRIAVDNFGTGRASLSFLREFPIDTVKIDKSFVHNIEAKSGKAVATALLAMAWGFNHQIVAEGIETQTQHAFFKKHHCAEGQGYYLGRPMTTEAFAALATQRNPS